MPPRITSQAEQDYLRIEKAIRFLEQHGPEQPDLLAIARHVHLSPFHFHRLFVRWAGLTPAQFLRHLTREAALERLQRGTSLLQTTLDIDLSSPGRLHDLFISSDGMTPGEVKGMGEKVAIRYGEICTPFGRAFLAWTPRGICSLYFLNQGNLDAALLELQSTWPKASFERNDLQAARKGLPLFGRRPDLHLRGTRFQLHVWRALLEIPEGTLVGYQSLAKSIGHPKASRAVGTAVGANPISVLIPCHRVIRQSGVLGNYRWGSARKKILSAWEAEKWGQTPFSRGILHGAAMRFRK